MTRSGEVGAPQLTRTGAFAAGAMLFLLPFLQSGLGDVHGGGGSPHMDHTAHHGGALLMLGDHHLEVVEGPHTVELYVSDAERRPLQPIAATVVFDGGAPQTAEWSSDRLVAHKPAGYEWADYRVDLPNAPTLAIRLPAGGVTMPGIAGR